MMAPDPPEPELTDDEAAELVAYLDGHVSPGRAAALERRIASDPALTAALDRRRFAAGIINATVADTEAPHDLRLRLDALNAKPPHARVRKRPRWLPYIGMAGAAAAVALALVIAGSGSGLTVDDAVAAAIRPPAAAATRDPLQPKLLRDNVERVRFPDFAAKFGWKAVGTRTDEIGGRATRTVFYERGGQRIAYTIIAGDALDQPGNSTSSVIGGVQLRTFRKSDRTVVTWRRQGHTCVLSATTVDTRTLLQLAAWKGAGAVRF